MIGTWKGVLPDGQVVEIAEQAEFGPFGGKIEAMAPVNGTNIIRVCIRNPETNELSMGKIVEETYALVTYENNGKGYNDYPMDVRKRMKFFTVEEKKAQRAEQQAQSTSTSSPSARKAW